MSGLYRDPAGARAELLADLDRQILALEGEIECGQAQLAALGRQIRRETRGRGIDSGVGRLCAGLLLWPLLTFTGGLLCCVVMGALGFLW